MFKKNPLYSLIFLGTLFFFMSCNHKPVNQTSSENWDKLNLRSINIEDTAYFNAIKAAQDNLDLFVTLLNDKKNNKYDYYIKSKFIENGKVEHMWLVIDSMQGDSLAGILDNVPNKIKNVRYKDKLTIAKIDVEDWIIYKKDSLILGNFISNAIGK